MKGPFIAKEKKQKDGRQIQGSRRMPRANEPRPLETQSPGSEPEGHRE